MSVKRLKLLIDLVLILSNKEFVNLQNYLGSYHRKKGNYTPKSVHLVTALRNNPQITFEKLKEKVSKESTDKAFGTILNRTYLKCLESLSLPVNTNNPDLYIDFYQTKFDLNRKLIAAQLLDFKGLKAQSQSLFHQVIEKAKEYELFAIAKEAIGDVMNYNSVRGNQQNVIDAEIDMDELHQKQYYAIKAKTYYHADFIGEEWKLHGTKENQLEQQLTLMESWLKDHYSHNLAYWHRIMRLNHTEYKEQNLYSLRQSQELVEFLSANTCVRTKNRIIISNLHLAHNLISLYRFKDALKSTNAAMEVSPNPLQPNYQLAMQYQFFAHYHSGAYGTAYKTINDLIAVTDASDKKRRAKRHYFRACIYFLRGEFAKSKKDLAETIELDSDKEGWNLNFRILAILNHIEQNKHDAADTAINTLYQHLYLTQKNTPVRKRYLLIYECLKVLCKSAYQFKEAEEKLKPLLKQLQSDDKEYSAIVLQPELIAFERWFGVKVAGKKRKPGADGSVAVKFVAA